MLLKTLAVVTVLELALGFPAYNSIAAVDSLHGTPAIMVLPAMVVFLLVMTYLLRKDGEIAWIMLSLSILPLIIMFAFPYIQNIR